MSQSTDGNDGQEVPDSEEKQRIVATDLRVGKEGRLTIPEEKRNRYGIEQGDFIDAVLFAEEAADGDAQ